MTKYVIMIDGCERPVNADSFSFDDKDSPYTLEFESREEFIEKSKSYFVGDVIEIEGNSYLVEGLEMNKIRWPGFVDNKKLADLLETTFLWVKVKMEEG